MSKAPAFQFYAKEFLAEETATYSLDEIGAYSLLLAFDWTLGGLPVELEKLAKLCRVSPRKMRAIWSVIGDHFPESEGRRCNPQLQLQRAQQAENRAKKQHAANTRWNADADAGASPDALPPAADVHIQPQCSAVASASAVSTPPPPAHAREAEPEKPHTALEARLAERLVSDSDRNALTALVARVPSPTTWLAEMQASLDGMAGHVLVTPEQLGQALRDYSGNGAMASPGLKHFRTYLRRASQPAPAHAPSDDFDTAVSKHTSRGDRASLEAEAAEVLATIRGLIRSHDLHGQGRKDYLPKSEVEKLGPRALKAYESVGGADRVLSAAGDDISYLIRDFTKAYVHASPTPALVGGAA